jgi:hypothetical protein
MSVTYYSFDIVYGLPVVVQVDVHDGQISTTLWSLDCARVSLSDKQRLAAEYERDGDLADREGRSDGPIYRAHASTLLTQAHDLFNALNGATGSLSDRRAA